MTVSSKIEQETSLKKTAIGYLGEDFLRRVMSNNIQALKYRAQRVNDSRKAYLCARWQ